MAVNNVCILDNVSSTYEKLPVIIQLIKCLIQIDNGDY